MRTRSRKKINGTKYRKTILKPKQLEKVSARSKKNTKMVMCVESSLLDSVRLHLDLSKTDAMIYLVNDILKQPKASRWQDRKIPGKPILYSFCISSRWSEPERLVIEVVNSPRVVIRSIDEIWDKAAEEALISEIEQNNTR